MYRPEDDQEGEKEKEQKRIERKKEGRRKEKKARECAPTHANGHVNLLSGRRPFSSYKVSRGGEGVKRR